MYFVYFDESFAFAASLFIGILISPVRIHTVTVIQFQSVCRVIYSDDLSAGYGDIQIDMQFQILYLYVFCHA